jgi:hypothetical protein
MDGWDDRVSAPPFRSAYVPALSISRADVRPLQPQAGTKEIAVAPTAPTLAGFILFLRNVAGISTTVLPDSSAVIAMAYSVALDIVNLTLQQAGVNIYALAVYNLSTDNVINYAQDQVGQTYFSDLRKSFNTNGFVGGVVSSTGDEGTNQSMVIQQAAENFTMANIQQLKTPYGRQYMAFAQSYGSTIVGLS